MAERDAAMMKETYSGKLIVFEGIDGAGKTTQAHELILSLNKLGHDIQLHHEPNYSPWGEKLRKALKRGKRLDPDEELELFIKDRKYDVENHILPDLKLGKTVIMDRYFFATAAYQGARGTISPEEILRINRYFAPEPDIVFLLDINPAEGIKRIRLRGDNPNIFEREKYLEKVREIYLQILWEEKNAIILDGSSPIKTISDTVFEIVLNYFDQGVQVLEEWRSGETSRENKEVVITIPTLRKRIEANGRLSL